MTEHIPMWNLPGQGIALMSVALVGRLIATVCPGKSSRLLSKLMIALDNPEGHL